MVQRSVRSLSTIHVVASALTPILLAHMVRARIAAALMEVVTGLFARRHRQCVPEFLDGLRI